MEKNLNIIAKFKETIKHCNLLDMGYKGYPFTWSNRRYRDHYIEERLDRFLCSKDWGSHFQTSAATNLISWVTDHCPIVLEVKERGDEAKHGSRAFTKTIMRTCGARTKAVET